MRLLRLIINEFRFLWKYGIDSIYCVFAIFYLCLLTVIPSSAREVVAVILVFTDPAAMGLFFMGAVVLLEKSQRVSNSISVSPVLKNEYIFSKVFTLMVTGCVVGALLCLFAGMKNILIVVLGIALASVLFSLVNLLVASKVETLNGFLLATVPFEIIICLPSILTLFGVLKSDLWHLHPGVASICLIQGSFCILDVVSVVSWCIIAFFFCKKAVEKSFVKLGGGHL